MGRMLLRITKSRATICMPTIRLTASKNRGSGRRDRPSERKPVRRLNRLLKKPARPQRGGDRKEAQHQLGEGKRVGVERTEAKTCMRLGQGNGNSREGSEESPPPDSEEDPVAALLDLAQRDGLV